MFMGKKDWIIVEFLRCLSRKHEIGSVYRVSRNQANGGSMPDPRFSKCDDGEWLRITKKRPYDRSIHYDGSLRLPSFIMMEKEVQWKSLNQQKLSGIFHNYHVDIWRKDVLVIFSPNYHSILSSDPTLFHGNFEDLRDFHKKRIWMFIFWAIPWKSI